MKVCLGTNYWPVFFIESESRSVVSNSVTPWTWDSPGQNTRVGSHSLLQEIFPTQESHPGLPHCGFFTNWATREAW